MSAGRQRFRAEQVREPADGMWSNCLRVGDLISVSGMTARGADGETVIGDEYDQAMVIFGKIRDLLAAAGAQLDDVLKMTIFVTDITQNAKVWDARKQFFTGDFPTCTLVQVAALAKPEIRLEIEALAVAGSSTSQ
ncbi:RidA family protein [Flexivirga sp.]|uniref:RidA family protein n=1 Tax=Flexivirga sp. TaxID=1962927 RepID=UPI003F809218